MLQGTLLLITHHMLPHAFARPLREKYWSKDKFLRLLAHHTITNTVHASFKGVKMHRSRRQEPTQDVSINVIEKGKTFGSDVVNFPHSKTGD